MSAGPEWGPLSDLAGVWEGDKGLDVAYANTEAKVIETPYRERMVLAPFGPVENGPQVLYGLDYRTAAWRAGEENPFHTEVGYWMWDAAARLITRSFVIPRAISVLASGEAEPDAREFTLHAEVGSTSHGILCSPFLLEAAGMRSFDVTVTSDGGSSLAYRETTVIDHRAFGSVVEHTDQNVLTLVSDS